MELTTTTAKQENTSIPGTLINAPFLGQANVQFSAEQCVTAVIIGRWAFQHVMLRLYLADWDYYISQVPTVQFILLYLPNVCFEMK